MGDSWDLVIRLEEVFHIEFESCEEITTAGELHRLICARLQQRWPEGQPLPCASSAAFYRLRRFMVNAGAKRQDVQPAAPLDALLPPRADWAARQQFWQRIAQETGLAMPRLARPLLVDQIINMASLSVLVVASIYLLILGTRNLGGEGAVLGGLVSVIFSLVFWIWLDNLASPLAVHVPANAQTVGDLTRHHLKEQYNFIAEHGSWTEEGVWQELRLIIAEEGELSIEQVHKDSRFAEDLKFY